MFIRSHHFSAKSHAMDPHLTQSFHLQQPKRPCLILQNSLDFISYCSPPLSCLLSLNMPGLLSPFALTIPFAWNAPPQINAWLTPPPL